MGEEKKDKPQDGKQESFEPLPSTTEYVGEAEGEQAQAACKKDQTQKICNCSCNITVNVPSDKKPSNIVTNTISIFGLLVSGIVGWYTIKLFRETQTANTTAINALNSAKESEKAQNIRYEKLDAIQKSERERVTEKDSENLELGKQSLQAQINSIRETQRQFTAANQPFLQVDNFSLSDLVVNKVAAISFNLASISDIPVKVISKRTSMDILAENPTTAQMKSKFKGGRIFESTYMIRGTLSESKLSTSFIINKQIYDGMESGNLYLFLFREITYKNLVTGTERVYSFLAKIKHVKGSLMFTNNTYVELLYNENK